MTTSADLLTAVGRALFGDLRWKAAMADVLEVRRGRIDGWSKGRGQPPPGVWLELAALIQDRESQWPALKVAVLHRADDPPPLVLSTVDSLAPIGGDAEILVRCARARPDDARPVNGASVELDGRPCTIVCADPTFRVSAINRNDIFCLAMKNPGTAEFLVPPPE